MKTQEGSGQVGNYVCAETNHVDFCHISPIDLKETYNNILRVET
jgi:hypothetical protein